MHIRLLTFTLRAPWCHSLKEKRMVVKSLLKKIQNEFNVSVIESDLQEIHQSIEISLVYLAGSNALADQIYGKLQSFIIRATDAEVVDIQSEVL